MEGLGSIRGSLPGYTQDTIELFRLRQLVKGMGLVVELHDPAIRGVKPSTSTNLGLHIDQIPKLLDRNIGACLACITLGEPLRIEGCKFSGSYDDLDLSVLEVGYHSASGSTVCNISGSLLTPQEQRDTRQEQRGNGFHAA